MLCLVEQFCVFSFLMAIFKNKEWSQDGIDYRLKYTSEQTEYFVSELEAIRSENVQLRSQVDLLKAVVIRMDNKINNMDREITDLRGTSMRDNIIVHNFPYTPNEDLKQAVPEAIKAHLGVEVDFVRIHRNGTRHFNNGKPVTITGKLSNGGKKEELLRAQKEKKLSKIQLPFFITAQEPLSVSEERKRLYEISDAYRRQNVNTRVAGHKIIMPNGNLYGDPVSHITNADVLQMSQEEIECNKFMDTVSTEPVEKEKSVFFASGASVSNVEEVKNVYMKVCCDPDSASSHHRILVYRFVDSNGKLCEGFHDDGEHGAGRRLINYMRSNNIRNTAAVITRWFGGRHIGYERFHIMENLVCEVANMLDR